MSDHYQGKVSVTVVTPAGRMFQHEVVIEVEATDAAGRPVTEMEATLLCVQSAGEDAARRLAKLRSEAPGLAEGVSEGAEAVKKLSEGR